MKGKTFLIAAATASLALLAGAAFGQTPPAAAGKTPDTIEGEVTQVDAGQGKIRVRARDGTLHEFQAGQETLKQSQAGDPIKAKLRKAPPGN